MTNVREEEKKFHLPEAVPIPDPLTPLLLSLWQYVTIRNICRKHVAGEVKRKKGPETQSVLQGIPKVTHKFQPGFTS